jgi:hypothetical protein
LPTWLAIEQDVVDALESHRPNCAPGVVVVAPIDAAVAFVDDVDDARSRSPHRVDVPNVNVDVPNGDDPNVVRRTRRTRRPSDRIVRNLKHQIYKFKRQLRYDKSIAGKCASSKVTQPS